MADSYERPSRQLDLVDFRRAVRPVQPGPEVPAADADGYVGDAQLAAEHLRMLGWDRDRIAKILRGPDRHSIHEIAAPDTAGEEIPETTGEATEHRTARLPDEPNQADLTGAIVANLIGEPETLEILSANLDGLTAPLQAYVATALAAAKRLDTSDRDAWPARVEGRDVILGLAARDDAGPLSADELADHKKAVMGDEVAALLPAVPPGTAYGLAPTYEDFRAAAARLELYRGMAHSLFEEAGKSEEAKREGDDS